MRVRAKALGFYDNARRRVGDVFVLKGQADFADAWMEKIEEHMDVLLKAEPKGKAGKHGREAKVKPSGDTDVI